MVLLQNSGYVEKLIETDIPNSVKRASGVTFYTQREIDEGAAEIQRVKHAQIPIMSSVKQNMKQRNNAQRVKS